MSLLLSNTRGSVMVLSALMMPLMISFGAMAVDAGAWFMDKRNLQTAADAASIAAAYEYVNGSQEDIETAARREAENNGLSADGELELTVTETEDGNTVFAANLSDSAHVWFANLFFDSVTISANATSQVTAEAGGSACILSLDEDADHGIRTSGNVTLYMPDCGLAVNSSSDEALYLNGSVDVDVGDVWLAGDYESIGAAEFDFSNIHTNAATIDDPYADLDVPGFTGCSSSAKRTGNRFTSNRTLSPGVYCGGITISGNTTVTFNPGVYILDGGDFKVTGNGSMVGEGVTFILTNSGSGSTGGSYGKLDIAGGRTIRFTAPTEGDLAGVVFYQDRDAPETASNSITGTADIFIDGAMYFPNNELTIGGNATDTNPDTGPCSRIIARIVVLHGTPHLGNECEDSAARDIDLPGAGRVSLIQ